MAAPAATAPAVLDDDGLPLFPPPAYTPPGWAQYTTNDLLETFPTVSLQATLRQEQNHGIA